ncbi:MAG: hypothetical protein NTV46_10175 [Verrucomicrobia bacterium]|nr:hypothetical protein [Verrucomicrobiota bacterium]
MTETSLLPKAAAATGIAFPELCRINPHFPAYRSGHRLFQRPSPQKQFPSIEKNWTEEVGNECKLWKAGVIGAGVLAAGAGIEVGRRWPKGPVKAVPMPKEGLLVKLLKKRRK